MRQWCVGVVVLMAIGVSGSGLTGCAQLADATEKFGATETVVPYTAEAVGPVAEAVVRDFDLQEIEAALTKVDARIAATNAEGKAIVVTVTPAGRQTAKVEVSNDGGKDVAEQILRAIEDRLDAGGEAAVESGIQADDGAALEDVEAAVETSE